MGVTELTIRTNSVADYMGTIRQLQIEVNKHARGEHPPKVAAIIPNGQEDVLEFLDKWGVHVTNRIATLTVLACLKYDRLMDDVSEAIKNEAA